MADITKENRLKIISEMVSQTASQLASEEVRQFEEDNPKIHVDAEVRELISQRAASELMFHTCNFKCPEEESDEKNFRDRFMAWYASEEEQQLRNMCRVTVKSECNKRRDASEDDMTFTDRFLKKVHEEGKQHSTVSLLNEL